jgi:hypothetical protein
MQFWSLGRSGLFPVNGSPSLKVFTAAIASCGAPRPQVSCYRHRSGWQVVELGLVFHSGNLFRCHFTVALPFWRTSWGSVWYRGNGTPRALKPSRINNPLSSALNRSLIDGGAPRHLYRWERVLLWLGF